MKEAAVKENGVKVMMSFSQPIAALGHPGLFNVCFCDCRVDLLEVC